jgi:plasmid stabilization system protein ParE
MANEAQSGVDGDRLIETVRHRNYLTESEAAEVAVRVMRVLHGMPILAARQILSSVAPNLIDGTHLVNATGK